MNATEAVVTIVIAAITSGGAITIKSIFARPRVDAEASKLHVDSDIAKSSDAREWAEFFRADATEARSRAAHAESVAQQAMDRCDDLELKFRDAVHHITQCHEAIALGSQVIPPLPSSLNEDLAEG